MTFFKKTVGSYILIFLIFISFIFGVYIGNGQNKTESPELNQELTNKVSGKVLNINRDKIPEYLTKDVDFNIFWQVWDAIKSDYVDTNVMDTQLYYGALRGLVASLRDPYSIFLEPETSKKFQQELAGSFEGIGAEIGIRQEQLTIIAPLPGNPAEKAGLKAGDKIFAIDGEDTTGMSPDYAVNLIRGPRGTTVKLIIMHNGDKEPKEVDIMRDTIRIVSVSWNMETGTIANIKLKYFNEDTLDSFDKIADEITAQKPKGIILDMRNNPGGFLTSAIEISSNWVDKDKIIVSEKLRNDLYYPHKASNKNVRFKGIPTVVLINRGSASASEIVAGALQDYKLAVLVGETSFGKGSVQDLKQFKDGSSLKLTVAKWLTPAGRIIDKEGIKEDIEVKLTEQNINDGQDPQLDKALEILRQ